MIVPNSVQNFMAQEPKYDPNPPPFGEAHDLKMLVCSHGLDLDYFASYYKVPREGLKIIAESSPPRAHPPPGKAQVADITVQCQNFTFKGRDWYSSQSNPPGTPKAGSLHQGSYIRFYAESGGKKQAMDQFNLWDYPFTPEMVKKTPLFYFAVAKSKKHDGIDFYLFHDEQSAKYSGVVAKGWPQGATTLPPPKSSAPNSVLPLRTMLTLLVAWLVGAVAVSM